MIVLVQSYLRGIPYLFMVYWYIQQVQHFNKKKNIMYSHFYLHTIIYSNVTHFFFFLLWYFVNLCIFTLRAHTLSQTYKILTKKKLALRKWENVYNIYTRQSNCPAAQHIIHKHHKQRATISKSQEKETERNEK